MTNILIPTDFTTRSLDLAASSIQALGLRGVNIILFHAFEQPDDPHDLMSPSRTRPYSELLTEDFRAACKRFREENAHAVQKIYFRFLEGETIPLFRRFLDANDVDLIYCPDEFPVGKPSRISVDPRPLFSKAHVPVIREFQYRKAAEKGQSPAATETPAFILS